ncbi:hexosaminidase D-like isoform X1 [Schistocerca cancellata]|uniref:hexosaminidase D-like isoform X1 n=1 Tax=Schistocerca cancellata TaxID=274614 RepID=UPI00211804F9|nr:hexosaminidase D-like isoform X1 [Schistocerca cancellata]
MESLTLGSHRLVHLDFKGAPPKVTYLEQLFPLFREWGATGILIEWEDTFPYVRDLISIGSKGPLSQSGAYTVEEARLLLHLAGDAGLAVVPLVQTFGHLEFVLKHKEWVSLREVAAYPSSMCPSHPGALKLVTSLIKQIVEFHPDIQYIHIGADEVWHLGICPTCIRRIETSKHGKAQLFLEHILGVAQFVRDTYPTLRVIMWDDMLRSIDPSVMNEYNLGKFVEPMVWHYLPAEAFQLSADMWERYASVFNTLWVATAFKGATGSSQNLPVIQHHISNHEQWLTVLSQNVNKFPNFRGVALTGWSRYDHYAIMCELLATSLPSLAVCLRIWMAGTYSSDIHTTVAKALGYYDTPLFLNPYPRPQPVPQQLSFPGWKVRVGVEWFMNLRVKYRNIVDSEQVETWLNPWQIQHGLTNPMQIESLIPAFTDLMFELTSLESYLRAHLEDILHTATVDEWIGTNIEPLKVRLRQLKKDAEAQMPMRIPMQSFPDVI